MPLPTRPSWRSARAGCGGSWRRTIRRGGLWLPHADAEQRAHAALAHLLGAECLDGDRFEARGEVCGAVGEGGGRELVGRRVGEVACVVRPGRDDGRAALSPLRRQARRRESGARPAGRSGSRSSTRPGRSRRARRPRLQRGPVRRPEAAASRRAARRRRRRPLPASSRTAAAAASRTASGSSSSRGPSPTATTRRPSTWTSRALPRSELASCDEIRFVTPSAPAGGDPGGSASGTMIVAPSGSRCAPSISIRGGDATPIGAPLPRRRTSGADTGPYRPWPEQPGDDARTPTQGWGPSSRRPSTPTVPGKV